MTQSDQEGFPTMKKNDDDESSLHEFPSFCPPVSLTGDDDKQEVTVPPLYPFPRMRRPQNRGLSMPTVLNTQNGNNKSNKFNLPEIDEPPHSPSSALPKLVILNSSVSKINDHGSVPASGRKTSLAPTVPKASPLKPMCLQTIVPRRRNASVLGRITNVSSPLQ